MSTRAVTPRNRHDRDAGLARIKRLTRWALAGAVAGSGLFVGLAAQVGGVATSAANTAKSTTTPTSGSTGSSATTPSTATTVAPSSAPVVVTSGAS